METTQAISFKWFGTGDIAVSQHAKEVVDYTLYKRLGLEVKHSIRPEEMKAAYESKLNKLLMENASHKHVEDVLEAKELLENPDYKKLYDTCGLNAAKAIIAKLKDKLKPRSQTSITDTDNTDGKRKKAELLVEVRPISLRRIYTGGSMKIKYLRDNICEFCKGKGYIDIKEEEKDGEDCEECEACEECKHTGIVVTPAKVEVNVEKGGENLQAFYIGHKGNKKLGFARGDLIICLMLCSNEKLRREGNDLVYSEIVHHEEGKSSQEKILQLPDGSRVLLSIPPRGRENEISYIFPRKGMPSRDKPFGRGDLHVRIIYRALIMACWDDFKEPSHHP